MHAGQTDESESLLRNLLLRGLLISLLIHLLGFGCYKWGQAHGWWRANKMPVWMQMVQKRMMQSIAIKVPAVLQRQQPQPRQVPMLFVDVDPALSAPTPPKEKKYYGAANTQQASPVKKDSDTPQINGQQDKVLKTTEENKSKAQPPQPSPPKPAPEPEPTPVAKQPPPAPKPEAKPEPKPAQPEPKQAQAPGDLTMAKPQDKPQEGKAPTEPSQQAPQPVSSRPRTLDEARKRAGLQGSKMQQSGGSRRLAMDSSLDVTRTAAGDYDREFVDAVQERWFKLLEDRGANMAGKVVLEFRLYYDGRITDMKTTQNEVGELLGLICQKSVLDPAPYRRWPPEMRREINADYREIKFTFYYLNH